MPSLSSASLRVAVSSLAARSTLMSLFSMISILQHVFVIAAHYLADGVAGENGLGHLGFLGDDGFSGFQHFPDVLFGDEDGGAVVGHHVVAGLHGVATDVDRH